MDSGSRKGLNTEFFLGNERTREEGGYRDFRMKQVEDDKYVEYSPAPYEKQSIDDQRRNPCKVCAKVDSGLQLRQNSSSYPCLA